ncbi:NAD-P-binding protein [Lentinula edodes]|uniref:NAD-P-binding protein n=1 Tax=Lentinula edodes TaxID=5353 RepID=UPI001E8DC9C7|nr:NAD-P-binding protein [Lentinula edodes]KAH7869512.1 NAD-P-binding protein [Lentinula edodes]
MRSPARVLFSQLSLCKYPRSENAMSTQIDLEGQCATNLFNLKNVVAVVTGGGSGIGLMISSTLIANGATVYIIGPKQADLDRICGIYNDASTNLKSGSGGKMYGLEGDISSKTEAKRLAEEVAKVQPYVTVLFNNAGIQAGQFVPPSEASAAAYVSAFFDKIEPQDFNNVLNTNAVGAYWLTFAFLPLLEKWKNSDEEVTKKFVPQVIMTSSMNGWTKDSATSGRSYPYMFSKSAIGHATSSLAHELLPLGIRVNGIAPGLFPTEMSLPGHSNEAGIAVAPSDKKWGFEIPTVKTGGTKHDVGALALCLITNWFINGETVLIDGGTLLKHPSSY